LYKICIRQAISIVELSVRYILEQGLHKNIVICSCGTYECNMNGFGIHIVVNYVYAKRSFYWAG